MLRFPKKKDLPFQDNTFIVAGFPGVGKTNAAKHMQHKYGYSVSDSDSSQFPRDDTWPDSYINHIGFNVGYRELIFVSSHEEVRKELVRNGLWFNLVYPTKDLLLEYLERYRRRGNNENFINYVTSNWDQWLDSCDKQQRCTHIPINSGQFLSDYLDTLPNLFFSVYL